MIKPIVKDVMFLGQVSEPSTKEDAQVARDLRDTLAVHRAARGRSFVRKDYIDYGSRELWRSIIRATSY